MTIKSRIIIIIIIIIKEIQIITMVLMKKVPMVVVIATDVSDSITSDVVCFLYYIMLLT